MNDDVLLAKFTKLSRCVGRIREKTPLTTERMRKAVGFRNLAVHEYSRVDWEIVIGWYCDATQPTLMIDTCRRRY